MQVLTNVPEVTQTVELKASERMKKVHMSPPNLMWPKIFAEEKIILEKIFGDSIVYIEHIGSTAIAGIYAKPLIDILIAAKNIENIDHYNSQLEQIGYCARGEFNIPGRRFFTKGPDENRTHHIHTFQIGSPDLERHLRFRDFLISNPEKAKEYSDLKRELAQKYPDDIQNYCLGKNDFIKKYELPQIST